MNDRSDEIRLVYSGNDFFDTMENIIHSAKHTIHFQTYIFEADETGEQIFNALQKAVARGVKVNMILDAFGSKSLSNHFIKKIKEAGIHFRWFAPFFSIDSINLGRRLHHKVIVVDRKIALIGGINISKKYKGDIHKTAWLDYAVLIKGDLCKNVHDICFQIAGKRFKPDSIKNRIRNFKRRKKNARIQLQQNDRLRGKNQISKSYTREIRNAKHSITLVASYFLPGRRIKNALLKSAKKGVTVNIILTGVADVPFMDRATHYLYGSFLKHGITIYEWKKSVLHGKLALIDDKWATIGSFNLNHLSALRSIEMNVDVRDESFILELKKHLNDITQNSCEKIDCDHLRKKNGWFTRLLNTIAYYVTRMLMRNISLFPKIFSNSSKEDAEL